MSKIKQKQHTVKVEWGRTGKIEKVFLTRNGDTKELRVGKKRKVFDGEKLIGVLKQERIRWFDNQYKIVFTPQNDEQ